LTTFKKLSNLLKYCNIELSHPTRVQSSDINHHLNLYFQRRNTNMLISLRQLLDHAAENSYGLPAFNVNNMEQIHAIMQAASATDSPVIIQASAGARSYAGEPFLRHLMWAAVEMYPSIPIAMHQDHGSEPAVCMRSIQSGFTSVMMDGSLMADMKTPSTYEYNVDVTKQVVDMAHSCGVSVEGELGCLGSLESGMAGEEDGSGAAGKLSHDQLLTDLEQAADFVKKTGVDTALINSPVLPQAKFWLSIALKKFTPAFPILTSSCTVLPPCRKTGCKSSTTMAVTWAKPTVCQWKKSSKVSRMGCAKSTLTPIYGWPPQVRFANS
jgi:Fructose-bisphosphate aldolase class-II